MPTLTKEIISIFIKNVSKKISMGGKKVQKTLKVEKRIKFKNKLILIMRQRWISKGLLQADKANRRLLSYLGFAFQSHTQLCWVTPAMLFCKFSSEAWEFCAQQGSTVLKASRSWGIPTVIQQCNEAVWGSNSGPISPASFSFSALFSILQDYIKNKTVIEQKNKRFGDPIQNRISESAVILSQLLLSAVPGP